MIRLIPILLGILACGHGGHGPGDIETYISKLESPQRVEVLQVSRVLEELKLPTSITVADIGSGPGVFSIPLAHALPGGLVYAVDVEPKQLDALRARASAANLANLVPVLASFDDPFLPDGRIDLVLIVDTYHHIDGRVGYFRRLQRSMAPGARLAIVEWKPGDIGMGPPPAHKLAPGMRETELREAGFERSQRFDFHMLHDFEVWEVTRSGGSE